MKKILSLFATAIGCVCLSSCNANVAEQVIGRYNSPNNGSIEITSFDGDEGEFLAYNVRLPRLNDGQYYTTPTGEYEVFMVARSYDNNDQLIRFSIDGTAYIAMFCYEDMTIEVEGTTYVIQK